MRSMVDQLAKPVATTPELEAWMQLTYLTMAAVSDHAMQIGDVEVEPFRRRLQESIVALESRPTPAQVLVAAGSLSQAIMNYSCQTQRRVDFLLGESRSLINMLLTHLAETPVASEVSVRALGEAGDAIQAAVSAGEFSAAKEKLANYLESLGKEHEASRKQSEDLANGLQDRVTILEQSAAMAGSAPLAPSYSSGSSLDACTGLPDRTEAEAAIRSALAVDGKTYVAAFYLHRMNLANARFGKAIGDQVIVFCSQHLSTLINSTDSLYRWTGPAFVAILQRQESAMKVSGEIQRIVSTPLSRFFETASRTVYLPVKMTGDVFETRHQTYAKLTDQIEKFILSASGAVGVQ